MTRHVRPGRAESTTQRAGLSAGVHRSLQTHGLPRLCLQVPAGYYGIPAAHTAGSKLPPRPPQHSTVGAHRVHCPQDPLNNGINLQQAELMKKSVELAAQVKNGTHNTCFSVVFVAAASSLLVL